MRQKLSTKSMEDKCSAKMVIQIPTTGEQEQEEKTELAEQKMED
jgi:hypothetical protein